jgi:hypothetical protein
VDEPTAPPSPETSAANRSTGRWRKHAVELVTITVGVLIALSLEGIRQWMSDVTLVREAEETVLLEIEENRSEILRALEDDSERELALDAALLFADQLLADGVTDVDSLSLGFSLAEVSAASWASAERTGAIAHMDYDRVRDLSGVYEAQELFVEQQRRALGRLSAALAILATGDDPTTAAAADLHTFRSEVLGLRAELYMQQQLAARVLSLYEGVLAGGRMTVPGRAP